MSQVSAPIRPIARHPLASLLVAVVLIAGTGGVIDAFVSADSDASQGCSSAEVAWRPVLKEALDASNEGRGALLVEWHAREAYDRVWVGAASLLGSSELAPPRMRFLAGFEQKPSALAAMWVGPDEEGCRTIFITPGQRRALGKQEGNWRSRAAALTRTLHETAHYFQSDDMLYDLERRELGASRWATAHGPEILGTGTQDGSAKFVQWRDRDQFGANYGGDPQTFGWPGLDPRTFFLHAP
jgi:hypothetical protein